MTKTLHKDRQIPLVDEEVKALKNYIRFRNTEIVLDDDILFLAKNGTSLNVWYCPSRWWIIQPSLLTA